MVNEGGPGAGHKEGSAIIVALTNQKGGVGKTTITRNLAWCCAMRGLRVLAIDCDPHGGLTTLFGDKKALAEINIAHALMPANGMTGGDVLPLQQTIVETDTDDLHLVPANSLLAGCEWQKISPNLLRRQVARMRPEYDLILIDCPPQIGRILSFALNSADYVLVVCKADVSGHEGLEDLGVTIQNVELDTSSPLRVLGAVMNMAEARRAGTQEARDIVAEHSYIPVVFDTAIENLSEITYAAGNKLPVVQYKKNSRGARLLWELTDEFLRRLGLSSRAGESAGRAGGGEEEAKSSGKSVRPRLGRADSRGVGAPAG